MKKLITFLVLFTIMFTTGCALRPVTPYEAGIDMRLSYEVAKAEEWDNIVKAQETAYKVLCDILDSDLKEIDMKVFEYAVKKVAEEEDLSDAAVRMTVHLGNRVKRYLDFDNPDIDTEKIRETLEQIRQGIEDSME